MFRALDEAYPLYLHHGEMGDAQFDRYRSRINTSMVKTFALTGSSSAGDARRE